MSIESLTGLLPSLAGLPGAQAAGDAQRAQAAAARQQRDQLLGRLAARAGGVTDPEGRDMRTEDRDANGRQGWTLSLAQRHATAAGPHGPPGAGGPCGSSIDLVG